MDQRPHQTNSSIPFSAHSPSQPGLPTLPEPQPCTHAGVKPTQEAPLALGHFIHTVYVNARVHQPPPPLITWGFSLCPWHSTLPVMRQRGNKCRDQSGRAPAPLGPYFDEFLSTQAGLEQMGSVSWAELHQRLQYTPPYILRDKRDHEWNIFITLRRSLKSGRIKLRLQISNLVSTKENCEIFVFFNSWYSKYWDFVYKQSKNEGIATEQRWQRFRILITFLPEAFCT